MAKKRSESRIKTKSIRVRVTPEEKLILEKLAAEFAVSCGELVRTLIRSAIPESKADLIAVEQLAATRADLGRIGGLLKGWLAGSFERQPPGLQTRDEVVNLLRQIKASQKAVVDVAQRVVKSK